MKKRFNLAIEDYDMEFLKATADIYGVTVTDLLTFAVNMLTATNGDDVSVIDQSIQIGKELAGNSLEKFTNGELMKLGSVNVYIDITRF